MSEPTTSGFDCQVDGERRAGPHGRPSVPGESPPTRPPLWCPRRLMTTLVVLIALHSAVVGAFLVFTTPWGVAFGGWQDVHPLFFPRQAGVFHFVLAAGYLIEYFRYRGVLLLLTAKAIAVLFLIDAGFRYGGPWAVPLSAGGDAAMGLLVWWLYPWTRTLTRCARACCSSKTSCAWSQPARSTEVT